MESTHQMLKLPGRPDSVRLRFYAHLYDAIGSIVRDGLTLAQTIQDFGLSEADVAVFQPMLE